MRNVRVWLVAAVLPWLVACGGGSECSLVGGAVCGGDKVVNVAPVAQAGAAQSVLVGAVVTLDGSASADANRDALTYQWAWSDKPLGSAAVLSDATLATPRFTADVKGDYRLSLVVSDGRLSSAPSAVLVRVSELNAAPVANAGSHQSVLLGALVTLDGRDSADANLQDVLNYRWTLSRPDGTQSVLTGVRPVFTASLAGLYLASLTVSDGVLTSEPMVVRVQVSAANAPPVARAGAAKSVDVGGLVSLDGTDSSDANGDALKYTWSFVSQLPAGSAATLANPLTAKPSFTADVAGVYVLGLVVNDGQVDSAVSVVVVTASPPNVAPVARAGAAQTVAVADEVSLSGSASTDANGDVLTYNWALANVPEGSTAALVGANSVTATFTADLAGVYVATLTVSDGRGGSHVATVPILAE